MYFTLSEKNFHKAVVDDNGWPFVEASGQRWERIDSGIWQNTNTGNLACRQDDGSWSVEGKYYSNIKTLMLSVNNCMEVA